MNRSLFCRLRGGFRPFIPTEVDMFASPGNAQLGKFVSRHPHWQAVGVDALKCPLEGGVGQAQEDTARPTEGKEQE